MPGFYDENDDFEDESGSSPKDLRAALAKANKALKAKEAELAERDTKIAELSNAVKSTSLRDRLADAGIDPKYATRAERDGVEPTDESVKQWIDENKDVYVFLNKPAAANADEAHEEQAGDLIDPDLEAGVRAGQQVESTGRTSGFKTAVEAVTAAKPDQFKSEAELLAFLGGLGALDAGD